MRTSLASFILAMLLLALPAAFRPTPAGTPTSEQVFTTYRRDLLEFQGQISRFESLLSQPDQDPEKLRDAFRLLRRAYKRVEYLLAYLDEENARDYLNGPPLPWVNRAVAGVQVMEPMGLQIIEAQLYEEASEAQRAELQRLTRELSGNYAGILAVQQRIPPTDRQILEAARTGILRITTLGLVGFDTPASGESLQESAVVLEALRETLRLYFPYLPQQRRALADTLENTLEGALRVLEQRPDFDTFDRLNFIRTYLEPLYGQTGRLHDALGIEKVYHVTQLTQPLRYDAPSMFSEALLNDHYFSGIGAAQEPTSVIALGRLLFFDPILSENNERACASCHRPERAFTDGLPKSEAMNHAGTVSRNAPTLINSVFADKYFYDLRTDQLENQAEHVIFNPREFNTTYYVILDKIGQSAEYTRLFQEAFGRKPGVQDLTRALAAYVRSLQSFDSPVDRYLRGENVTVSPEIQRGFNLFMGKALCGTCHFAPTYSGLVPPSFSENESEVIGVPLDPEAKKLVIDPDPGRFDNGRPRDRAPQLLYSFKTPTVRNAALTAPYMHHGAYKTLESVVDFYNKGGGAGLGLELPHQTLPFDQLNLSQAEQKALVAFMEALTDTSGMTQKPVRLPAFEQHPEWNRRVVGGSY